MRIIERNERKDVERVRNDVQERPSNCFTLFCRIGQILFGIGICLKLYK